MTYLNLIIRHVSYPVFVYSIDACDVYRLVAVNVVSFPCFFNILFFHVYCCCVTSSSAVMHCNF